MTYTENEGIYYNNEYTHFIMYCLGFLQHDTLSCACGPGLGLEMDESCWFPSMIDHQAASKEKKKGILTMQGKEPKILNPVIKRVPECPYSLTWYLSATEVEIWFGSNLYKMVYMAM